MRERIGLIVTVALVFAMVSSAQSGLLVTDVTQTSVVVVGANDGHGGYESIADTVQSVEFGGDDLSVSASLGSLIGRSTQSITWSSTSEQFRVQGSFQLQIEHPDLELLGGGNLVSMVEALILTTEGAKYRLSVPSGNTTNLGVRFWDMAVAEQTDFEVPPEMGESVIEGDLASSWLIRMVIYVFETQGGLEARDDEYAASFQMSIVENEPLANDSTLWGSVKALYR